MQVHYISHNLDIHNSDRHSDEYIKLNSCGWGDYRNGVRVSRPNGRLDYQFVYVAKGSADFNGNILKKGDMYLYRPGEPQIYTSMCDDYSHYWIHFTGKAADMLFKDSTYNIINTSLTEKFEKFCKETVKAHSMPNISYRQDMITEGNLLSLISSIAKELDEGDNKLDKRIEKIIRYIQDNPTLNLTNQQYAEMTGMSKYHFIRTFTDNVGVTPQKYRTNLLLEKSLLLLEDSDLRINEIASNLGFDDIYYFSRLFKKQYGIAPTKYRS